MSIGFLNENMSRSYPLQPVSNRDVCPWIVDLILYLGPDVDYDVASDTIYLNRVEDSGASWTFVFRVESDVATEIDIPVTKTAGKFSTHHGTLGRSYGYLTAGDLSTVVAGTYNEAVEDRCIVAPEYGVVESITVANGQVNQSLHDVLVFVPGNPTATFDQSMLAVSYDPDVQVGPGSLLAPPEVEVEEGYSVDVRVIGGELVFSLRGGAGAGWNCDYVVPVEQSYRNTVRSFAGQLASWDAEFSFAVGSGMEIETDQGTNKITVKVKSPQDLRQCKIGEDE